MRNRAGDGALAGVIARNGSVRAPLSLVDARLEILPHQIEPVLAVLGGVRRLLIADEVGLGKTIQAGLIIAELQRRTPSIRVLVILPAALSEQWQQELDRRFGITSDIVCQRFLEDAVRAGPRGTNPWTRAGVWLASVDYLSLTPWRDASGAVGFGRRQVHDAWAATRLTMRHAHGATRAAWFS
jgi:superfamily II DNA or RNA helicase